MKKIFLCLLFISSTAFADDLDDIKAKLDDISDKLDELVNPVVAYQTTVPWTVMDVSTGRIINGQDMFSSYKHKKHK